jgi:hypothetical protein
MGNEPGHHFGRNHGLLVSLGLAAAMKIAATGCDPANNDT